MGERLAPMVDRIGDFEVKHGERGPEFDSEHPMACLCGHPDYFACPGWDGPDSILGAVIEPNPANGFPRVRASDAAEEAPPGDAP